MLVLLLLAQAAAPPEFQSAATFQTSSAASTVDGTTHTAAEQRRIDNEILRRLQSLPGLADGVRLIELKLYPVAEAHFRKNGQPAGVAAALYLDGKTELAIEVLLAAPRDLTVLPFLGEMGHGPKLAEAIREISAANPLSGEALYYLARVTESQPDAERLLTRASELDTKDTRALMELARLLDADRPKAIAAIGEALKRDPSLASAHYRLASLYRAIGDMEKSREHLAAFQKLRK